MLCYAVFTLLIVTSLFGFYMYIKNKMVLCHITRDRAILLRMKSETKNKSYIHYICTVHIDMQGT